MRGERGQAIVELALIIPVTLLLLLGVAELGFVLGDGQSVGAASREGARTGAMLGTGGDCSAGADPAAVDAHIVAAVEQVLRADGLDLARVEEVRIYRAGDDGLPAGGMVNTWSPGPGPVVGGWMLAFAPVAAPWPACGRQAGPPAADPLGVEVRYLYRLRTPLGALMTIASGGGLVLSERTIMSLGPEG